MIAANDIQNAQREAALDRAHSMCIDKIATLESTIINYKISNNALIDEINELKDNRKQLDEKDVICRRLEEVNQGWLKKVTVNEQTINGLLDLDDQRLRKIEDLAKRLSFAEGWIEENEADFEFSIYKENAGKI